MKSEIDFYTVFTIQFCSIETLCLMNKLETFQTYDSGIDINLGEKSPGDSSEDIEHRKVKSLKQVDVVAWIILLTISIECFIGKCVE